MFSLPQIWLLRDDKTPTSDKLHYERREEGQPVRCMHWTLTATFIRGGFVISFDFPALREKFKIDYIELKSLQISSLSS